MAAEQKATEEDYLRDITYVVVNNGACTSVQISDKKKSIALRKMIGEQEQINCPLSNVNLYTVKTGWLIIDGATLLRIEDEGPNEDAKKTMVNENKMNPMARLGIYNFPRKKDEKPDEVHVLVLLPGPVDTTLSTHCSKLISSIIT
ncbi:hypothetical protein PI124_g19433 [Phytophthora idaei]|nr:hypothetical protein PI125_g18172 [Phytophthora idaei]KAG3133986.1 hypothetical protein PI126_g18906 [Phytophthora idaei]KAG3235526.1 hypothetical protein PI124_g19433 [Phytophthora idaei]